MCNYCPTGSTRELGYWSYGEKYVTPKCMQLSPNPLWLYWGPCLQEDDLKLLEGIRLNLSCYRLVSRMRIQIPLFQSQEQWYLSLFKASQSLVFYNNNIILAWDDSYSQSPRLVQTDLNISEDLAPTHFCLREWPWAMCYLVYLQLDERSRKFLSPNILDFLRGIDGW